MSAPTEVSVSAHVNLDPETGLGSLSLSIRRSVLDIEPINIEMPLEFLDDMLAKATIARAQIAANKRSALVTSAPGGIIV